MTIRQALLVGTICLSSVSGFAPVPSRRTLPVLHSEATATTDDAAEIKTDPKEAVKLFGRLAEKYIMLDASAGMCCYSGCTGEFNQLLIHEIVFWLVHNMCSIILPHVNCRL